MISPEQELLLAILRQAIKDYLNLDPDSDTCAADYYISEGEDYKTAEDFLYNSVPIPYGTLSLTFQDLCFLLKINKRKIYKYISENFKEF